MAFELTNNALNAASRTNIEPQIVVEIDGYSQMYGAIEITQIGPVYGNPNLTYGMSGLTYGSTTEYVDGNISPYVSFKNGTTTSIRQQLNTDKGTGDSISSMRIALIDKNESVTANLLTPDSSTTLVKDILGRKAKVYLGFNGTEFKEDYIIIFRGTIDSVESRAGIVTIQINHPDSKKRGVLFATASTKLNGSISSGITTLTVDDASAFLDPSYTGPSGSSDSDIEYMVRIEDEIIKYTGKTSTTLTGCTRGYLGTTAAAHDDDVEVNSVTRLTGNAMDLSLKLMLSGWGDNFVEGVKVHSFVKVDGSTDVANSIVFKNINVETEYNIRVGDYVTTTGAIKPSNNITNKQIVGVTVTSDGSYIIVDGVSFVKEPSSPATISFRSQYDVWPEGAKMAPNEVDIAQHLYIKNSFLTDDTHYDFRLQNEIELKEFLGEQVYNPLGCYAVPRNAKSSVNIHLSGLLPTSQIKQLNNENVINPKDLSINRSTTKNFFNAIVYKYDQSIVDTDKYLTVFATTSDESRSRINVGVRALVIESNGLRSENNAENFADSSNNRRLKKFRFGAEFLRPVKTTFEVGFSIEIGDIVLVDMSSLKISDIKSGSRSGNARLYEVVNKELDIRTGKVTFELVDGNFDQDSRYGLMSPVSFIASGISTTVFTIEESYNHSFGVDEYRLWEDYVGASIVVRSINWSTYDDSVITGVDGNQITVSPALSFTPSSGMVMEMYRYTGQTNSVKTIYVFMSDSDFSDGSQYKML